MNEEKLKNLIQLYKTDFVKINKKELYKWQAVKFFQDNWDIESDEFISMLPTSLSKSLNLLNSQNYFPLRMIVNYTEREPETVRKMFRNLYDEERDLIERISEFQTTARKLNAKYYNERNDYQDRRAVLVYLCLKYPDRYFLFKHNMFKQFVKLVDYPYTPKRGTIEQVLQYLSMCALVREQIILDNELLQLHKTRIGVEEYSDVTYNILTQDVIYASTRHLQFDRQQPDLLKAEVRLLRNDIDFTPIRKKVELKGVFINHLENARRNKHIGDLGELLVMDYEKERLAKAGIKKAPVHVAKNNGDGLGYDILSYDAEGNPIYIEVKTTTGDAITAFFITDRELLCSKMYPDRYYLYRLYNFDSKLTTAEFFEIHGDLNSINPYPIAYKVELDIN